MRNISIFIMSLCCLLSFNLQAKVRKGVRRARVIQKVTPKMPKLPEATFYDSYQQEIFNNAAKKYYQATFDSRYNGKSAEEMLITFYNGVSDALAEKSDTGYTDIRNYAAVVRPVFLKFLEMKRISQPTTLTGWINTIQSSLPKLIKPLEEETEGSGAEMADYAYEKSLLYTTIDALCASFIADKLPTEDFKNKLWKMETTSKVFISDLLSALSSCNGGGTIMGEILPDQSSRFSQEKTKFLKCLARMLDNDTTLANDEIVNKYLSGNLQSLYDNAISNYKGWYTNSDPDIRRESAQSDVENTVDALTQFVQATVEFIHPIDFSYLDKCCTTIIDNFIDSTANMSIPRIKNKDGKIETMNAYGDDIYSFGLENQEVTGKISLLSYSFKLNGKMTTVYHDPDDRIIIVPDYYIAYYFRFGDNDKVYELSKTLVPQLKADSSQIQLATEKYVSSKTLFPWEQEVYLWTYFFHFLDTYPQTLDNIMGY